MKFFLISGEEPDREYLTYYSYTGKEEGRFTEFRLRKRQMEIFKDAREAFIPLCKSSIETGDSAPSWTSKELQSKYIYSSFPRMLPVKDQIRCQLIAPCGIGKTTMSPQLALIMEAKNIAFVCPLLLLVKQTVWEYKYILEDFKQDGKVLHFDILSQ